jgi:hypothetical protein
MRKCFRFILVKAIPHVRYFHGNLREETMKKVFFTWLLFVVFFGWDLPALAAPPPPKQSPIKGI